MVAVAPATRSASNERAIAAWLLVCCAMIFFMVVIGGITRLTESGLSITQWHPIEGVLPPLSAAQWENAFARYKGIPQYEAVHPDMDLAQFKHIYFWEYFHRLWGRLIGAVFLLPFLYFLLRGRIARSLVPKLAGLFVLGGLQGLLGWYMVMSGLETRIEVSQYRLAAHLGMAVVIYLAMLWVALDLVARPEAAPRGLRRGTSLVLGLVFVTMVAGAFVAGTRAGYIDNTFPLMEGHLVPPGYLHLAPWWRNWFENLAAVQFDHRVLAVTTWCAIALLWAASLRARLSGLQRGLFHALFFFACLQVALGISTLLTVVALPVAVAHQAGAMLLITAALVARHAMRRA
jgi:heme a synthase